MRIRQNPLWLWNPEETSPEIQNRGTSGPKIGHVNVSDKKTLTSVVFAYSEKSPFLTLCLLPLNKNVTYEIKILIWFSVKIC